MRSKRNISLPVFFIALIFIITVTCFKQRNNFNNRDLNTFISENFLFAQQKISYFLENLDVNVYPGSIDSSGKLITLEPRSWESGYLAGILWNLYEYSGEEKWKIYAQQWTAGLELQKFYKNSHDLGFMLYSSFGNGYKLTHDDLYKDVLIVGASSLASRYDPEIGLIKSWDNLYPEKKLQYPVIIDAVLANELLFYVFRISGDSLFYKLALNHALNSAKYHVRDDYSTYYVIDFDTITGQLANKVTTSGYSDESTWSRGQARAIYGFAITFRETGDSAFLDLSKKTADFYMNHPRLPSDLIPYWDFDDPEIPNAPRDASAAAIAASGLLELCSLLPPEETDKYFQFAVKTLVSLSSDDYRNKPDENLGFILKHSTGSKSLKMDVDKPKISADYYFIEALTKLNRYHNGNTK